MRKKDLTKLNITAVKKAANVLNLKKEEPSKTSSLYPITECLQLLKNMYTQPNYTRLTITSYAWTKLMAFIHLVGDYEVSGFGRIQDNKITDFDIIKQEVKATYVESDADSVLEFIMNTPPEQRSEWILDWHSHVNMGTTPSSTDWTNYYEMLTARQNKQFPAIIVNKKGEVTANQIICENKYTKIEIYRETEPLTNEEIETLYNQCKDRVEHYCTRATSTTTYSSNWSSWDDQGTRTSREEYGYGGYRYDDDYDYNYNNYYGWKLEKKNKEDNECRVNAFDLTQEQIKKMEKQGIVFDEETGEAYEEDECCESCGRPLKTETEMQYGVCLECFKQAMVEEACEYDQNSSK